MNINGTSPLPGILDEHHFGKILSAGLEPASPPWYYRGGDLPFYPQQYKNDIV